MKPKFKYRNLRVHNTVFKMCCRISLPSATDDKFFTCPRCGREYAVIPLHKHRMWISVVYAKQKGLIV